MMYSNSAATCGAVILKCLFGLKCYWVVFYYGWTIYCIFCVVVACYSKTYVIYVNLLISSAYIVIIVLYSTYVLFLC